MKVLSLFLISLLFVAVGVISAQHTTPTRYGIVTRSSPTSKTIDPKPLYFENFPDYQIACSQHLQDGTLLANASFLPTGNVTGWNYFRVTGNQKILASDQTSLTPAQRLASRNSSDAVLVYKAAGILEGFLMTQEIIDTFLNIFWMPNPPQIDQFMDTNIEFIRRTLCDPSHPLPANATSYGKSASDNEYIVQLCKLFFQVEGIADGFNAFISVHPSKKPWNMHKLSAGPHFAMHQSWGLNAMASFMDYYVACNISMMMMMSESPLTPPPHLVKSRKYFKNNKNKNNNKDNSNVLFSNHQQEQRRRQPPPPPQQEQYILNEHCSALVKVTDDDVWLAHDTWAQFNQLIRKYAVVELETTLQYSGYCGLISSSDDFIINDHNKIIVTETTFQQGNTQLTQQFVTPYTVPEFFRSVIASFLAKNGQEWGQLFLGDLNDGTYCNSWPVLSKNLISRDNVTGKIILQPGALYLVENMPGPYSVSQDVTSVLRSQSYFPGYNVPYAKSIFNLSGALALEEQYGSYFSFDHCARANIFRRDHVNVTDLQSMVALMRSNRFKTDPFSVIPGCAEAGCDPAYSPTLDVAARGDLADPNQSFGTLNQYMAGFFGPSAFGALDVKVTSVFGLFEEDGRSTFNVQAQAGPTTFDGLPPLVLGNLAPALQMVTYGQFQGAWNFPLVNFTASGQIACPQKKSNSNSGDDDQNDGNSASRFGRLATVGVALGGVVLVAVLVVSFVAFGKKNEGAATEGTKGEDTRLIQDASV